MHGEGWKMPEAYLDNQSQKHKINAHREDVRSCSENPDMTFSFYRFPHSIVLVFSKMDVFA